MKLLILMVQFFTRIPLNMRIDIKSEDFAKGVVYFPWIGLIVGGLNAIVYYLISQLIDGFIPLLGVIIVNILVTGALHLDGLADSCDGVFSARKKTRMLEIMRDSRIGTNGAIALNLSILMRLGLLYTVPRSLIIPAIILMPVLGRTIMSLVIYEGKYAREGQGMGDLFIGKTSGSTTLISFIQAFMMSFILLKALGVAIFAVCIITGYLLRMYFNKVIGGLTGDLLGAINEVVEIIALFTIIVLWRL